MSASPALSVVVNNYNYGRFVGEAIDSVLAQEHDRIELIVIDDGSTDNSRAVIAGYGRALTAVFKGNGGQASALNAGYRASTGRIVIFLDADDLLLPGAVRRVLEAFEDETVVKAHWPLEVAAPDGRRTGQCRPHGPLPSGDLRESMRRLGPAAVINPPMSGNAFARALLNQIMPIPAATFRLGADAYLYSLAPFLGVIARIDEPVSLYRQHGSHYYSSLPIEQRIEADVAIDAALVAILHRTLAPHAGAADVRRWGLPFSVGQQRALQAMEQVLPGSGPFILVDEEQWGAGPTLAGRPRLPFLERDGEYWGMPASDDHAVSELERLRREGADAIVFVASTFWWLEHYQEFARHLSRTCRCVASDDAIRIFDLRNPEA